MNRITAACLLAGLAIGMGLIWYGQRLENPQALLILTPKWVEGTRQAEFQWDSQP